MDEFIFWCDWCVVVHRLGALVIPRVVSIRRMQNFPATTVRVYGVQPPVDFGYLIHATIGIVLWGMQEGMRDGMLSGKLVGMCDRRKEWTTARRGVWWLRRERPCRVGGANGLGGGCTRGGFHPEGA